MGELIATFWALVLPLPERERYERKTYLDVPFWSFLLGWLQIFGAFFLLFEDYFVTMRSIMGETGEVMGGAANSANFDERLAYNWLGALNAVLWLLKPYTLFCFLVFATGVLRIASFISSRDSLGEPLFTLGLRISQRMKARRAEGDLQASLGPERPDRLLPGEAGEKILLSARQRVDWQNTVSVDFEGEIFQIVSGELKCPEGENKMVWVYHLREQPEGQLIRRLVRYEPR